MRVRHLWYHAAARRRSAALRQPRVASLGSRVGAPGLCDPERTIARLSGIPPAELGWFSRAIAWFTTPFKFLGLSGWVDTGCAGSGRGRLVRDAQHSTDGFWTLDVALDSFEIGDLGAPAGRFLRLECEPETAAHRVCEGRTLLADELLRFGGPIVIDTDGPFLEIHPADQFEVAVVRASGAPGRETGDGSLVRRTQAFNAGTKK